MRWQRSIDDFRVRRHQESIEALEKGVSKGFLIRTRQRSVLKMQNHELSLKQEADTERMERFRGHSSELSMQRQKNNARLNGKFRGIEDRKAKHRASLSYSQELQRQLQLQRERDAKLNNAHNKAVLDCIKERIWRKHKKV